MGGTSKQSATENKKTEPWIEAQPALKSILGQLGGINTSLTPTETSALDYMSNSARQGNQFAPQINSLASDLFGGGVDRTGMVTNSLEQYRDQLAGTARGDYLDPNKNPWFGQVTSTIGNDVQNRVNAMFANSGRDASGAGSYGQTVGRGVAEGVAPLFAQAYDQERGRQIGAQNSLYNAGTGAASLLSNLDQNALGNRQGGIGVAGAALGAENYGAQQQLAIEAQRRGIPISLLSQLAGIAGPIAGLGSQSQGTMTGTQTMSPAQTFATWAQGFQNLYPKPPNITNIGQMPA
jgi:hypothetical protein